MNTAAEAIHVDQFVPHPPARVWAALTTPEQLARWWAPGDIAPVAGHRFLMDMQGWGNVACEVLEAVEPERLVHSFADWTLVWRLVPEGTGTRLFLEQRGFDLDRPDHRFAFDRMGPGWTDEVLPRLVEVLGNLAVVERWHDAVDRADVGAARALATEAVEVVGPRGSAVGRDVLADWLERARVRLEPLEWFCGAKGTVVVHQRAVWHDEAGAAISTVPVATAYRVAGGEISRIARFDDLDAALADAGLTRADRASRSPTGG